MDPAVGAYQILAGIVAVKTAYAACGEVGSMSVLEAYLHVFAAVGPGISCDKVHFSQVEGVAVLFLGVVSARYVDSVVVDIFLYNEPRAAAESEALALSYGVEPVAAVFAEFTTGFYFDDRPRAFAEMAAYEVVVVDFTEETYTLGVISECVGQMCVDGNAPDFALWQIAQRECQVT